MIFLVVDEIVDDAIENATALRALKRKMPIMIGITTPAPPTPAVFANINDRRIAVYPTNSYSSMGNTSLCLHKPSKSKVVVSIFWSSSSSLLTITVDDLSTIYVSQNSQPSKQSSFVRQGSFSVEN